MATAPPSTGTTLKLLVDNISKKVLFAEAGKDFVDFLFGVMELPIGSFMSLLAEQGLVESPWSLPKVYRSLEELDNGYIQENQNRGRLLKPNVPSSNTKPTPILQQWGYKSSAETYDAYGRRVTVAVVDGYVKGVVTYMVMDDLVVKPMSAISCIALLNTLGIRDVGSLREKIVNIDMKKALELIKASFMSTSVLTDLFVRNEGENKGEKDKDDEISEPIHLELINDSPKVLSKK